MEYPGTKFTHPIRLALLLSLIGVFLIISPLIIMYTAGYRYDWQQGLLKETGSINIDVQPDTATVYLNNIKLNEQIPIRLNNIAPARYAVRISQEGYFDWNKEIEVKNKQTNYIKEISLLRKSKPELLIAGNIEDIKVSYDGRFILYTTKNNNTIKTWLWDNTTDQNTNLLDFNSVQAPIITWAEKNYFASIALIREDNTYSEIDIINALEPQKITNLMKGNPPINRVQWENSTEPRLYYSTGEDISLYLPETNRTQVIVPYSYRGWYMEDGQLWTIGLDLSTSQYKITKDTLGFSSTLNKIPSEELGSQEHLIEILAARNNTVLIKPANNSNMVLVTANNRYKIPASKFLISPYNNWWLLWSNLELWGYVEDNEPYLLNRSGEQLEQVMPLDQYNTLALVWANRTTALFPYYSVSHDLLNEKAVHMTADRTNKILYYIHDNENKDKNDDGIWRVNY